MSVFIIHKYVQNVQFQISKEAFLISKCLRTLTQLPWNKLICIRGTKCVKRDYFLFPKKPRKLNLSYAYSIEINFNFIQCYIKCTFIVLNQSSALWFSVVINWISFGKLIAIIVHWLIIHISLAYHKIHTYKSSHDMK